MRKFGTIFLLGILSISMPVKSEFYINYFSGYGIYGPDGSNGLIPQEGDTALIQLMYAGENNQVDEITDYNLSTGDDLVLGSFTYTNDGSDYSEFVEGTYGTLTSSFLGDGYIYGRVFGNLIPTAGTPYYIGHLLQASNLDLDVVPPVTPQVYNLGQGLDNQAASLTLDFETNDVALISLTVGVALDIALTNNLAGLPGVVSPSGTTMFYGPSVVSLVATAEPGYSFFGWTDEDGNTYEENPLQFSLSSDQFLTAFFAADLSDNDSDGLSAYDEIIIYGSNPDASDSSGDGLLDGVLVLMGLNPTVNFSNLVTTVQDIPESFGVYGEAYVQDMENTISNLNTLVQSKSNQIAVLEDETEQQAVVIATLTSENQDLVTDVNNLSDENNQLTISVGSLSAQVNDLNNELTSLDNQNAQLLNSVNILAIERDDLSEQIVLLQANEAQLNSSNTELQESVNTLSSENNSLKDQISSLEISNSELQDQITLLSTTNDIAYLAEQLSLLQSSNTFLNLVIDELVEENLGLEATNEYLLVSIPELQNEIIELELEIVDLETALNDAYVDYDYPWWKWDDKWNYPWHKSNNYWWGWGNPPARKLPKWGKDAKLGKRFKMKHLKKRKNNFDKDIAQMEVELCVQESTDLSDGNWISTTNNVSIDIPVDESENVKFYRIIYN